MVSILESGKQTLRTYKKSTDKAESMTNSSVLDINRDNKESFTKSKTQIRNFKNTATDKDVFIKVLRMIRDTQKDKIIFTPSKLREYASSLPLTERSVLEATVTIYDPLTFLSSLAVTMIIPFQDLCVNKSDWDRELHGETMKKRKTILQELNVIDCY